MKCVKTHFPYIVYIVSKITSAPLYISLAFDNIILTQVSSTIFFPSHGLYQRRDFAQLSQSWVKSVCQIVHYISKWLNSIKDYWVIILTVKLLNHSLTVVLKTCTLKSQITMAPSRPTLLYFSTLAFSPDTTHSCLQDTTQHMHTRLTKAQL